MKLFRSNKKKIGFKLASNNRNYEKWDRRFLNLAKTVSEWSKDPSTKVGAVIVDEDLRIVSIGYNGLPKGIEDDSEILNNRELKLEYTVHAEINSILFSNRSNLSNCTLYTYPLFPCSRCCTQIIQSKIKMVISVENNVERWKESINLSKKMLIEAKIDFILYDPITFISK